MKGTRSNDLGRRVDDVHSEEVEIVVAHIRRLMRTASLEFALAVGGVIIHHFYGGDTDTWRSRGPKTSSFRRLADHPDLPMSAGALYRCVALFELCERFDAPSRWKRLGASHLRQVLGLPPASQEKLLSMADANRWTVTTLHEEVLRNKAPRVTSGGRRAAHPIAKRLKTLLKSLEDLHTVIERAGGVPATDVERTRVLVRETEACLERLSGSLQAAARHDSSDGDTDPRSASKVVAVS